MSHLVLLRNDFGEEIRDVVSGGDVLDVEDSGSDLFFDPMVPQGDMFRPGLDHLVFGEGDRRLIVNKNCSWLLRKFQFFEKSTQPNSLPGSQIKSNIFGFTGAEGNKIL